VRQPTVGASVSRRRDRILVLPTDDIYTAGEPVVEPVNVARRASAGRPGLVSEDLGARLFGLAAYGATLSI
jgi:hypothetical protein